VWNPTEATAIKIAPKIKLRISPSFMGVTNDARTALFQDGFAVSAKSFVHGRVLGVGPARLRSRTATFRACFVSGGPDLFNPATVGRPAVQEAAADQP
jgi:hypothetical protein